MMGVAIRLRRVWVNIAVLCSTLIPPPQMTREGTPSIDGAPGNTVYNSLCKTLRRPHPDLHPQVGEGAFSPP